ncbi:MAG: hypothetical protein JWM31_34 [Solirubrobacterales bacterium]|nr:hypothetical protein [Solirubrobacterales bacterium]
MSNDNFTGDGKQRDLRSALLLLTRGRQLRDGIRIAHERAASSDTAIRMVRVLDVMELPALMLALNEQGPNMDGIDEWLMDECRFETERREQALADWKAA